MHRDTYSSIRCSEPHPDLGCLQGWGIHQLSGQPALPLDLLKQVHCFPVKCILSFWVTLQILGFTLGKLMVVLYKSSLDIEMVGFSSHGYRWFSLKITLGGFSCLIGFSVVLLF